MCGRGVCVNCVDGINRDDEAKICFKVKKPIFRKNFWAVIKYNRESEESEIKWMGGGM